MIINLRNCAAGLLGCGLLVGVLSTTSCTDLTEHPYQQVTQANFHPTAQDIGSLIAPVYTPLMNMWMGWYGNIDTQEESSDELITPVRPNGWYDGGTYIRMHQHRWDPNEGQPGTLYSNAFRGINSANRVIYQLTSQIPVDDKTKAATIAELRAVRAYNYAMLLDNFANVPIVTDFTATDLPTQATRQQVYDFVVKEFTDVIPLLTDVTGTPTYGRINKWVAMALLARVYLNAQVYTGTPHYDLVIPLTQQIIASGKFTLDATYRQPFARNNNTSVEDMWSVPYDAIYATASDFHMKTLKPDLQAALGLSAQPWGGSASNPQFIDTYDPDDGRLKDTWLIGPVFDATGQHGYNFVKYVPRIDSTGFANGYPVWKYEIYAGETGSSDVDYPIVRYAEVLMMQAEAQLRMGNADAAAALVTQVRQRDFKTNPSKAVVTGADLVKGSSYDYGWDDIDGTVKTAANGTPVTSGGADIQYGRFLDELGWEFAIEGHRRSDLIRFGVYTKKTWFNHKPNGDFRALFPLPASAINTNKNLKQNPGY
jgi:hypothetical protein